MGPIVLLKMNDIVGLKDFTNCYLKKTRNFTNENYKQIVPNGWKSIKKI